MPEDRPEQAITFTFPGEADRWIEILDSLDGYRVVAETDDGKRYDGILSCTYGSVTITPVIDEGGPNHATGQAVLIPTTDLARIEVW